METNISVAASPPPACLAADEAFTGARERASRGHYIVSTVRLPGQFAELTRQLESWAELRLCRTAIAIERARSVTGTLPKNLDEIVPQFLTSVPKDPFDGAPVRYRSTQKGYVVYSVGEDRKDDGGKEFPRHSKGEEKETYDITFIVER